MRALACLLRGIGPPGRHAEMRRTNRRTCGSIRCSSALSASGSAACHLAIGHESSLRHAMGSCSAKGKKPELQGSTTQVFAAEPKKEVLDDGKLKQIESFLAEVPLFQSFEHEDLETVAKACAWKTYKAGEIVILQALHWGRRGRTEARCQNGSTERRQCCTPSPTAKRSAAMSFPLQAASLSSGTPLRPHETWLTVGMPPQNGVLSSYACAECAAAERGCWGKSFFIGGSSQSLHRCLGERSSLLVDPSRRQLPRCSEPTGDRHCVHVSLPDSCVCVLALCACASCMPRSCCMHGKCAAMFMVRTHEARSAPFVVMRFLMALLSTSQLQHGNPQSHARTSLTHALPAEPTPPDVLAVRRFGRIPSRMRGWLW